MSLPMPRSFSSAFSASINSAFMFVTLPFAIFISLKSDVGLDKRSLFALDRHLTAILERKRKGLRIKRLQRAHPFLPASNGAYSRTTSSLPTFLVKSASFAAGDPGRAMTRSDNMSVQWDPRDPESGPPRGSRASQSFKSTPPSRSIYNVRTQLPYSLANSTSQSVNPRDSTVSARETPPVRSSSKRFPSADPGSLKTKEWDFPTLSASSHSNMGSIPHIRLQCNPFSILHQHSPEKVIPAPGAPPARTSCAFRCGKKACKP